jgi:uncharacterized protein (TIGR03382 family)
MRASVAAFLAVAGLASAANAQSAVFSVVLSSGSVANGATVTGTVRCTWTDTAGIGYAGGAFRLRMNDSGGLFGPANVLNPNNSSGGVNGESATEQVTFGQGGTNRWTFGRRPKRVYLDQFGDPTSGGGFRFPTLGTGPTDVHYSAEPGGNPNDTLLTGRNGANVENRIEHAQVPPGVLSDPLFFENSTSFDLFKFAVRAPLTGSGTVTITPEVLSASIYISDQGAQHMLTSAQFSGTAGSFTYTPSPSTLALLGLGGLVAGRRRR